MSGGGIEQLLASYPRARPPLSPAHAAIYTEHYRRNREGLTGIARTTGALESWAHRTIAASAGRADRILEVGAGNLNHIPYEPSAALYDAVEPFAELWRDSPHLRRVNKMYASMEEVPEANRYDRVVSIFTFEHLTDLPWILARCGLLLAQNGSMCAAIPTEGGLCWGIAWRLTSGVAFRLRYGLDYAHLMRHEHVNSAREILALVRHFYREVKVQRFPLPFFHLSFYTVVRASRPVLELCRSFCQSRPLARES